MIEVIGEPASAALFGLAGGIVLGLAARLARFCSLGAIEDAFLGGSNKRIAMWAIAIGVALVGCFTLSATGQLDLAGTFYHTQPFSPILVVVGGLVFGYGMSLAGNCGFGALARMGGGDLRSFVIVLVLGICAYVTLTGPLAPLRVAVLEATAVSLPEGGIAGMLAGIGIPPLLTGLVAGAAFLALGLAQSGLRHDRTALIWSVLVGLAIVSGWAGTQHIAAHGFEAIGVASHTYSAPVGETILFVMTASGGGLSFGVGSVLGVVVGAVIGSLCKGQFRWESCEDPRELRRQIAGAAGMGVGAVLAVGCTIGQGISAFSVLAYSAPLAVVSILIGAAAGLNYLVTGRLSWR
ncbi:MAG: YeeE/YedE family protein [Rhodobacteraceae bacterium]|nr:YeeE/YedE family protein [Paracoccaceae bacterium]